MALGLVAPAEARLLGLQGIEGSEEVGQGLFDATAAPQDDPHPVLGCGQTGAAGCLQVEDRESTRQRFFGDFEVTAVAGQDAEVGQALRDCDATRREAFYDIEVPGAMLFGSLEISARLRHGSEVVQAHRHPDTARCDAFHDLLRTIKVPFSSFEIAASSRNDAEVAQAP